MRNTEVLLRASVARNFAWALPKQKGTVEIVNFSALAEASVARNFLGALLSKKGTVK